MPGGRLTYQDRQHIASGLAEGLGYAEIARRLARPTSTISREVTRNGGADGYRADQAHRATGQRARRRKQTRSPAPPVATDAYGRDPEAVREVEERLTALMVKMGMPRIACRVLVSLHITDTGSLTAAELVQRLRVSPASISKAVGYLEGLELIRRERDARRRRDRYVVDDDLWFQNWLANAQVNAKFADTARDGAEILGAATPAGARLHAMSDLFDYLGHDMVRSAEHWWQEFTAARTMK